MSNCICANKASDEVDVENKNCQASPSDDNELALLTCEFPELLLAFEVGLCAGASVGEELLFSAVVRRDTPL